MNIYITLDYELYFGTKVGSAEKCMLFPTNRLIEIAKKHKVCFTFFVDAGYLVKLKQLKGKFKQLENDYASVTHQIKNLVALGHDVQLHVHPHWEDAYYNGSEWSMDVSRYKISDFSDEEAEQIILKYADELLQVTQKPLHTFRAGGWCIQPFAKFRNALSKIGVKIDSTVYKGGKQVLANYNYDFTNCPDMHEWRFSNDVTVEDKNGDFLELPIYSEKIAPFFFWKLFLLGRLNPKEHKSIGDGYSISVKGYRKKMLTQFTLNCANIEGYFASLLEKQSENAEKKGVANMVVIGHPKALTHYSLKKLDEYLQNNIRKYNFTTFSQQFFK